MIIEALKTKGKQKGKHQMKLQQKKEVKLDDRRSSMKM